jgi:4-amino-4-deoxy-L-arabinose transferase-like glycosyltransferase
MTPVVDMETRSIYTPPDYRAMLIVVLLGLTMLLPGTHMLPLLDRDEPRFSQATVEMMDRGEWIIPYFNQDFRFDKPILTYWLMRVGYGLFGINEFGARLHSILSTILMALCILAMGKRLSSKSTGLAAAFGLLTSMQVFMNGRCATADMIMILAVVVSQWSLWELLKTGNHTSPHLPKWFWLFYAAQGFGFLAKGPIVQLVPLLTLILLRWAFWRRPISLKPLRLHLGLPLVLLIVAAWGVPAMVASDGLFWSKGFDRHIVQRGLEPFNDRTFVPFFYLLTAFFSLYPWIAFAADGWQLLRSRWTFDNAYLVSWLAAPYLIFSFYATQLPHYVLPAFPAFFLILAQTLDLSTPTRKWWSQWWFRIVIWLPLTAAAALLVVAVVVDFQPPLSGLRWIALAVAGIIAAFGCLGVLARRRRWHWMPLAIGVIGLCAVVVAGGFRSYTPAVMLKDLFDRMPPETEYIGHRFTEGSLVFYSHRPWQMMHDTHRVNLRLQQPGPRLVVSLVRDIRLEDWFKCWIRGDKGGCGQPGHLYRQNLTPPDDGSYLVRRISGINFGSSKWVELTVLYRLDSR